MRPHDKHKWLTFGLCAYECVAIATGKVPTISRITKAHPSVGIVLTSTLAVHLWNYDRSMS